MKAKKLIVAVGLLFVGGAFAFPLEWMLVRGGVRDRLVATLKAEERLDELDFLMSVWEGDAWGAEAAARTLIDTTHDPAVTRWLAGYLRRTGRTDEADRLDPPRLRSRALKTAAPARAEQAEYVDESGELRTNTTFSVVTAATAQLTNGVAK